MLILTFFMLLFQSFTILVVIQILSENKLRFKDFGIMLLIAQGLGYLLHKAVGIAGIIVLPLFYISYLSIKTKKVLMSIIITFLPIILLIVSDYMGQMILTFIFTQPLEVLKENTYFFVIVTAMDVCFPIIFALIIKYIFRKFQLFRLLEGIYGRVLVVFLTLTLIIFYFNIFIGEYHGYTHQNIRANSILFLTYATLLFGVFLALIYVVTKDANMQQERIQNQKLQEYTLQLEKLYDNISAFRHDYINVLHSLEMGIKAKDIQEIENIYEKVVKPTGAIVKDDIYSLTYLRNLRVSEVKGILTAKMIEAQAEKVSIELEIGYEVNEIYMDLLDFCRVFSILLDNAIEAAIETKHPAIIVAIIQDYSVQKIIVENNCLNKQIDVRSIFEKGFSTKGDGRGTGLYTVRNLLNKNGVTLETSYKKGNFTQVIILKKNEE